MGDLTQRKCEAAGRRERGEGAMLCAQKEVLSLTPQDGTEFGDRTFEEVV